MQTTTFTSNGDVKNLYRLAGVLALLIALAGLTDALTSLGMQARDNRSVAVVEWFQLFQGQPFAAFSSLGVINMLTLSLGIPVYLGLNRALQRQAPLTAALAPLLFFTGAAVYLSSNTLWGMFALSRQYAAADAARQALLQDAGRALLAQGADLTPGTLVGLLFTQVAGLLIARAVLRTAAFGKWAGWLGLAGYSLMILFFVIMALVPGGFNTAMLIAAPGGIFLMIYQVLLARGFFRLAGQERMQA